MIKTIESIYNYKFYLLYIREREREREREKQQRGSKLVEEDP